jgi:hypothetical protein
VTIGAYNFTLVDLLNQPFYGVPFTAKRRNIQRLIALMIELQDYNITFSAIYTGVLTEVIHDKRRIDPVLFSIAAAGFLDICGTIGLVVRPAIVSLAALAHRLASSTLLATDSEVLNALRW